MIETIKVVDMHEAKKIAFGYNENTFTAWLSMLDPEDEQHMYNIKRRFEQRDVRHCGLHFRDSDDTDPQAEFIGPDLHDVQHIMRFFEALKLQDKQHHVGVNCYAGISRSTAAAMIGWMVVGYQPEVALDKVLAVRRCAWPNKRMLRFYDTQTGTNSEEVVREWNAEVDGKIVVPKAPGIYLNLD